MKYVFNGVNGLLSSKLIDHISKNSKGYRIFTMKSDGIDRLEVYNPSETLLKELMDKLEMIPQMAFG